MAASFNKVIVLGTITKDPELRATPSGKDVCEVRLAINGQRSTKDKPLPAVFVDVTLWEGRAVYVSNYGGKGSSLLVEGRLVTESWDDRETGNKMSKLKITADNVQLVGGGGQRQGGDDSQPPRSQKHNQQESGEDIPF